MAVLDSAGLNRMRASFFEDILTEISRMSNVYLGTLIQMELHISQSGLPTYFKYKDTPASNG